MLQHESDDWHHIIGNNEKLGHVFEQYQYRDDSHLDDQVCVSKRKRLKVSYSMCADKPLVQQRSFAQDFEIDQHWDRHPLKENIAFPN